MHVDDTVKIKIKIILPRLILLVHIILYETASVTSAELHNDMSSCHYEPVSTYT